MWEFPSRLNEIVQLEVSAKVLQKTLRKRHSFLSWPRLESVQEGRANLKAQCSDVQVDPHEECEVLGSVSWCRKGEHCDNFWPFLTTYPDDVQWVGTKCTKWLKFQVMESGLRFWVRPAGGQKPNSECKSRLRWLVLSCPKHSKAAIGWHLLWHQEFAYWVALYILLRTGLYLDQRLAAWWFLGHTVTPFLQFDEKSSEKLLDFFPRRQGENRRLIRSLVALQDAPRAVA